MSNPITPDNNEGAKRLVHTWLHITGYVLIVIGAICFVKPSLLADYLGMDNMTAMTLSGVLAFAGVMDIVIARLIFKGQDRR